MMALAVSGAALLLLAAALEDTESVEDGSTLGSVSRRLVLVLGALSLGSFPPFPGFYILFPLSSAVFERGYSNALIAAALLLFLVALGCLRLVSRAVDSHGARSNEVGIARAALVLSLVAILAFSIVPAPLAEIARIAALARN
jgi:formate hydrogenlyase subunit 3/multisubunit Na+/H+ antiporter MnhD subunit